MLGVGDPGLPRTQMTHILEELTHKMQGQPPKKRCQLGSTYVEVLLGKLFFPQGTGKPCLAPKVGSSTTGQGGDSMGGSRIGYG